MEKSKYRLVILCNIPATFTRLSSVQRELHRVAPTVEVIKAFACQRNGRVGFLTKTLDGAKILLTERGFPPDAFGGSAFFRRPAKLKIVETDPEIVAAQQLSPESVARQNRQRSADEELQKSCVCYNFLDATPEEVQADWGEFIERAWKVGDRFIGVHFKTVLLARDFVKNGLKWNNLIIRGRHRAKKPFIEPCSRCQQLGHSSLDCPSPNTICSYCSSTEHLRSSCPLTNEPQHMKCARCGKAHTNNYQGCEHIRAAVNSLHQKEKTDADAAKARHHGNKPVKSYAGAVTSSIPQTANVSELMKIIEQQQSAIDALDVAVATLTQKLRVRQTDDESEIQSQMAFDDAVVGDADDFNVTRPDPSFIDAVGDSLMPRFAALFRAELNRSKSTTGSQPSHSAQYYG